MNKFLCRYEMSLNINLKKIILLIQPQSFRQASLHFIKSLLTLSQNELLSGKLAIGRPVTVAPIEKYITCTD